MLRIDTGVFTEALISQDYARHRICATCHQQSLPPLQSSPSSLLPSFFLASADASGVSRFDLVRNRRYRTTEIGLERNSASGYRSNFISSSTERLAARVHAKILENSVLGTDSTTEFTSRPASGSSSQTPHNV